MKKIILIALYTSVINICQAQSSIKICEKTFDGYIFDSSFFVFKSIKNQKSRYSPSADDIVQAEKILRKGIKSINRLRINQNKGCPRIDNNLKKYIRQYVGFINEKGQKIIWINLFWNKDLEKDADKQIVIVNDGCSYYWNIEVNIEEQSLQNLEVNGQG